MPTISFTVKVAKIPDRSFVLAEVERVHETRVQKDLAAYFQIITGDWSKKNQPKLLKLTETFRDRIVTSVKPVGPNVKIWTFVTLGTVAHLIPKVPKKKGNLRFFWGGKGSYIPKTHPPAQYGGPGIVRNGKWYYRKQVHHPGNKGRFFEKEIVREYQPKYLKLMKNAVARGLRAAKK